MNGLAMANTPVLKGFPDVKANGAIQVSGHSLRRPPFGSRSKQISPCAVEGARNFTHCRLVPVGDADSATDPRYDPPPSNRRMKMAVSEDKAERTVDKCIQVDHETTRKQQQSPNVEKPKEKQILMAKPHQLSHHNTTGVRPHEQEKSVKDHDKSQGNPSDEKCKPHGDLDQGNAKESEYAKDEVEMKADDFSSKNQINYSNNNNQEIKGSSRISKAYEPKSHGPKSTVSGITNGQLDAARPRSSVGWERLSVLQSLTPLPPSLDCVSRVMAHGPDNPWTKIRLQGLGYPFKIQTPVLDLSKNGRCNKTGFDVDETKLSVFGEFSHNPLTIHTKNQFYPSSQRLMLDANELPQNNLSARPHYTHRPTFPRNHPSHPSDSVFDKILQRRHCHSHDNGLAYLEQEFIAAKILDNRKLNHKLDINHFEKSDNVHKIENPKSNLQHYGCSFLEVGSNSSSCQTAQRDLRPTDGSYSDSCHDNAVYIAKASPEKVAHATFSKFDHGIGQHEVKGSGEHTGRPEEVHTIDKGSEIRGNITGNIRCANSGESSDRMNNNHHEKSDSELNAISYKSISNDINGIPSKEIIPSLFHDKENEDCVIIKSKANVQELQSSLPEIVNNMPDSQNKSRKEEGNVNLDSMPNSSKRDVKHLTAILPRPFSQANMRKTEDIITSEASKKVVRPKSDDVATGSARSRDKQQDWVIIRDYKSTHLGGYGSKYNLWTNTSHQSVPQRKNHDLDKQSSGHNGALNEYVVSKSRDRQTLTQKWPDSYNPTKSHFKNITMDSDDNVTTKLSWKLTEMATRRSKRYQGAKESLVPRAVFGLSNRPGSRDINNDRRHRPGAELRPSSRDARMTNTLHPTDMVPYRIRSADAYGNVNTPHPMETNKKTNVIRHGRETSQKNTTIVGQFSESRDRNSKFTTAKRNSNEHVAHTVHQTNERVDSNPVPKYPDPYTQELLDYFWSYQGIGRQQVLYAQAGKALPFQGAQFWKYHVGEMVVENKPLTPLSYKSLTPMHPLSATPKTIDEQSESLMKDDKKEATKPILKKVETEVAANREKKKVHLVVKLPDTENYSEE